MAYTNSPLVTYKKISPNKTAPRNHAIDTITIHCMAGNISVESCGNLFSQSSRKASSNYGVGSDGRIALYVEEKDRSWCSSNAENDHRSVTIEVANDGGENTGWHVSDKALSALIELVADICKRNGIKKLVWSADKLHRTNRLNGCNMTVHRDFAKKSCPGDYLYGKHSYIADEVNKILLGNAGQNNENKTLITGKSIATAEQMATYIKIKNPNVEQSVLDMIPLYLSEGEAEGIRGDITFAQSCLETGNFTFNGTAVTLGQNNFAGIGVTSNGMKGNSWKTPQLGIRAQIQHLKAYANREPLKNNCIDPRFKYVQRGCAPYVEWLGIQENPQEKGWAAGKGYGEKIIKILSEILNIKKDNTNAYVTQTEPQKHHQTTFKVKVIIENLNYRNEPSMNGKILGVTGKGIFTITETKNGWGKLKSGAGWIYLENHKYCEII